MSLFSHQRQSSQTARHCVVTDSAAVWKSNERKRERKGGENGLRVSFLICIHWFVWIVRPCSLGPFSALNSARHTELKEEVISGFTAGDTPSEAEGDL